MAKKLRVWVLFGGRSAEHEVSIDSARTVLRALDPKRYDAVPVYISRQGRWELQAGLEWRKNGKLTGGPRTMVLRPQPLPAAFHSGAQRRPDVVFPMLHGPYGEDGTVQGFLELAQIPYVGAGVLGSALGMDKDVAKRLARLAGLRVAPHLLVRDGDSLAGLTSKCRRLGLPLFVKPCRLGSSVGIGKVSRWKDLLGAVRRAMRYDTKVLVEKGIEGMEVAVAVLGDERKAEASVPGAVVPMGHDWFDYDAKYTDPEGHKLVVPAPLPAAVRRELKAAAVTAFHALEGHGMTRVDFIVRGKKTVYFGEVNTIPGFTPASLYPHLWEESGVPLGRLLDRLISLAVRRGRRCARLVSKR